MIRLGIDFGGSGIKGALVNILTGEMITERHRLPTPELSTPAAITGTVKELVDFFNFKEGVGMGFPAAIINGIVRTASNIHESWIGQNASELFSNATGCNVKVLNDADAAGLAEMRFGHGKNHKGAIIFITIGTGIGTALFYKGELLPNTELGQVYLKNGLKAEKFTSDATRKNENLNWEIWGTRFNKYLNYLYKLFYPELIIIGGGASKKYDSYQKYINVPTMILPAILQNNAGIIGAAAFSDHIKILTEEIHVGTN